MAISIPFFGKSVELQRNARVNRAATVSKPEAVDGIVMFQKGNKAKVCWGPGNQTVEAVRDLTLIVE